MSPQNRINDVARVFQAIVRMKAADDHGNVTCCTCGKIRKWNASDMNAGHFISRSRHATVFHFTNCHPQCAACNDPKRKGNKSAEYERFMLTKYGEDVVAGLKASAEEPLKWTCEQLAEKKIQLLAMEKKIRTRLL
nr:MAG TPA: NinG recombination protein [Caudoviricetes sp.]